MKRILYNLIILVAVLATFSACEQMDHNYKKFVVPGGIIYPAAASKPMVHSGHNRVKITWFTGVDPSVVSAKIFWNNYTDSVEVNIPSTRDTVSVIIDNLAEGPYTFIIKTYDEKGHGSIPVEVVSRAYGSSYQASLLQRPVNKTILKERGHKIEIAWGHASLSNGAFATEVKYTDGTGNTRTQKFIIVDSTSKVNSISTISDIKPGSPYQYRTLFLPDTTCIDTFYTAWEKVNYKLQYLIPKDTWQVYPLPGDVWKFNPSFPVTNLWDGITNVDPNIF